MASNTFTEDRRLKYEIYHYSSFSTDYIPENILVDCPKDQSSRWSAYTNSPPQYLTLKLKRPAVVRQIKFGKFEKSHVCNIKKFCIYGGLEESHMVLLLEGGLKNDNIPEIFQLRSVTEDGSESLPILYLKIVPLLSWGPTFNFSIWYIELHGQDDPMYTNPLMKSYNKLREIEVVKLCLKHFRQQGYETAFKALQEQTQVQLEHPLISELHKCLVTNGDFDKAEEFIAKCIAEGLMDDHLNEQDYRHTWNIQTIQSTVQPGNRGGHQLVMDTSKRLVYLYGGWNGYQDLSDLWVFDITNNNWSLLFERTELFNGPTPRSCHKMVFDPISENIFVLGRYLDNSIRTTDYIKSDFYLYDTRARTWLQICDDTSHVGGPQLIYDHQMCIDIEKRTIYVFGGKVLTPRSVTTNATNDPEYSGLFSYHIATNTWTQILVDCHHPSASEADVLSIKSRITHCMVFHNKNRKLYIYGGQRGKEEINDFFTYDVDTQIITILNKDNQINQNVIKNEPSPGFTLRATIDCDRDEFYLFSSLSKLKDRREIQDTESFNSFWVYSICTNTWTRIYSCRPNHDNLNSKNGALEPCPRYAHQLVYDDVAKMHYLFGGNPGNSNLPQLRLDDFWTLILEKPKREEILKHCRFLVRKLHYEEMVKSDSLRAMEFLRKHISEVIDHSNPEQLKKFHRLATLLFKTEESPTMESRSTLTTPPLGKTLKLEAESKHEMDINRVNKEIDSCESGDGISSGINSMGDEDLSIKYDMETTNPSDDMSLESCESSTSSGISDSALYTQYRRSGGKRGRIDYLNNLRGRRACLFNKLVQLMPTNMVQPKSNLSDFVVM